MVSLKEPYIDGTSEDLYHTNILQPEEDFTTINSKKKLKNAKKRKYVIAAPAGKSRKMISNDRSIVADQNSQITESSATLDLGSITSEGGLKPWWSSQSKKLSQRLWLPTGIDSQDSHMNFLAGSLKNKMLLNSWFSTRAWRPSQSSESCVMTSSPSSQSFRVEYMAGDDISKSTVGLKSRLIKLKPTMKQRATFRKWFGDYRVTWNMALDAIKNKQTAINKYALRDAFVTAKNLPEEKLYLKDTHKDIRAGAIFDLVAAHKSCFTNKRNNNIQTFDIKFKSRRNTWTIPIPKSTINVIDFKKIKICSRTIKDEIRYYEHRNKKNRDKKIIINHDCKLTLDKLGDYYLIIPISNTEEVMRDHDDSFCALDPGVRTFQTLYDPNGLAIKIGDGAFKRIQKLCLVLDSIKSKLDLCTTRITKRKYKMLYHRTIKKIKNIRNELHWKVIRFLIKNYANIIIPPFETSRMTIVNNRKIKSKTARNMLNLAHGEFKDKFIYKAKLLKSNIFIRDESYTSKTCTWCGNINNALGSNIVFKCNECKMVYDRDIGAARNIFIKNVIEN
jgi:putative transposase